MEANAGAKSGPQDDPESCKSYRTAVETLRQRRSVSVFKVPCSFVVGTRAGGRVADAKQDQPRASEAHLTGETEKGSDARKELVTPEGSPLAGSKSGPEHLQELDTGDSNGQETGEGVKRRSQKAGEADKDWREPSTASTSPPASSQSANRRVLRARFSRRRGRGSKHYSAGAPSEALVAEGYNLAPPAIVGASRVTSVPRQKSRSLPLPDGTVAGTSAQYETEVSQLLQQLEGRSAAKGVRKNRSAKPVPQSNRAPCSTLDQTPMQSSTFGPPPWRQQHRRQLLLKPLFKRTTLHIMLPQGHAEAQKICFVLTEVAKAFHCKVDMCEAFQDVADCERMLYLPVGQSKCTSFVPTSDACSWPHAHAHGSQAEGKAPRGVTQKGTHNDAPRESQKASSTPDQLMREAFNKEMNQAVYPEVILSESPAEFISEDAAEMQDEF